MEISLDGFYMNDTIQWTIIGLAVLGFVFNSGMLWNDMHHVKKNIDKIWQAIDEINIFLRNKK